MLMPKSRVSKQFREAISNSQGSVLVTLILTLMVIGGIGFVYYYYTQLNSLGPPPIQVGRSIPTPLPETANWKPYQDLKQGISMKIPLEWYVAEDNSYISQFPYDRRDFASSSIYNDFYIAHTTTQLESGYTNTDWLNRINNLGVNDTLNNEFRPATTLSIKKLGSGLTAEGIRYVIFQNVASNEGIVGAFEKNDVVYEFVLRQYNQEGIDTMGKIMTTVEITAPSPTP
jgi:hypothetical protein